MTITEWRVASTNANSNKEFPRNLIGTTDISQAELAMSQVNKFFDSLGKSEAELTQEFEQNRVDVFEQFYGSRGSRD
ncbi:MAG: hypothetical protein ABSG01_10055 [Anaerolineales bacterium]